MESQEWSAQGGISFRILFKFFLDEVITDNSKLPPVCILIFSKFNILGYANDLVQVAPTAQALQLLLNTLTSKLSTLWLQVNVQNSCNIVFRHSNKKVLTNLTMNNQPLWQVIESIYLGVALTDDVSCAKHVERAKFAFFKQFNTLYPNLVLLILMYCYIFSDYTQCRFTVLKPGKENSIKKA